MDEPSETYSLRWEVLGRSQREMSFSSLRGQPGRTGVQGGRGGAEVRRRAVRLGGAVEDKRTDAPDERRGPTKARPRPRPHVARRIV